MNDVSPKTSSNIPNASVFPIHPPNAPPDPRPFIASERKRGSGLAQAVVFLLMLLCFAGGMYILFFKPNS